MRSFILAILVLHGLAPPASAGEATTEERVRAEEYLAHEREVRATLDAKEEAWRREREALPDAAPGRVVPPVPLPPRPPLATYDRGPGPIR
ncbi:MAG: hypothetical protein KDG89_09790 [Geminicoccaceae bacterium]|nr:hypothetical protein [Geminicoccaceae bacterium]